MIGRIFTFLLLFAFYLQSAHVTNVNKQRTIVLEMGNAFQRTCVPPNNDSDISEWHWVLQKIMDPASLTAINKSHISTNDEGTIFFHHVKETDALVDRYYTCINKDSETQDEQIIADQFRLNVTRNRRRHLGIIPPAEQYVEQHTIGFVHKIYCFFSSNPIQRPVWYHNGVEIKVDNQAYTFESFHKTLVFRVSKDKEGAYECRFPRAIGLDRHFDVHFEAR